MQPFKVHILGCGSALPTWKHFPSCQIVEVRDKFFMIDCGEGAQLQLRRARVQFDAVRAIFISHLHGDHCFGLIGLVCTLGMLGRTAPLHVYAPAQLGPMLRQQLDLFCPDLEYEVPFHEVDTTKNEVIFEDRSVSVSTIPLEHRMPCCGFLFREKPTLPHIRRDMMDFLHIPFSQVNNIKAGAGWTTEEGVFYPHERLVRPADPARAYAYCSDTRYMPHLHQLLKGVDLLYHESTYANDRADNARKYYHSTAEQAAMVARDAGVKHLLLGHYSSRYNDENTLLQEAKAIFPSVSLTKENAVFDV